MRLPQGSRSSPIFPKAHWWLRRLASFRNMPHHTPPCPRIIRWSVSSWFNLDSSLGNSNNRFEVVPSFATKWWLKSHEISLPNLQLALRGPDQAAETPIPVRIGCFLQLSVLHKNHREASPAPHHPAFLCRQGNQTVSSTQDKNWSRQGVDLWLVTCPKNPTTMKHMSRGKIEESNSQLWKNGYRFWSSLYGVRCFGAPCSNLSMALSFCEFAISFSMPQMHCAPTKFQM